MSETKHVGDLQIDDDDAFTRREWTVQRVGWAVLVLIVAGALLGLFGNGPLSEAAAENGPLRVAYDRFERKRAPTELRIRVAGGTAEEDRIELWLAGDFLDRIELQGFSPEPEESRAGADRVVYVFRVDDPTQPAVIDIDYQIDGSGSLPGRLGLVGGPELTFPQFVYP